MACALRQIDAEEQTLLLGQKLALPIVLVQASGFGHSADPSDARQGRSGGIGC